MLFIATFTSHFGSDATEAIPTLIGLLESKTPWRILETAAATLIEIGAHDPRVRSLVPVLLRSKSQFRRLKGLAILHRSRSPTAEMLDALAEQFDDPDQLVLESAIGATEVIFAEPQQCLTFLRRPMRDSTLVRSCLSHSHSGARSRMLRVLCGLGEKAREELPAILLNLQHAESHVRNATVWAVCRIASPEDAVALTVGLLHDPDLFVRHAVLQSLAELGPKGETAIPHLQAFIKSTASAETALAVIAIHKIRPRS